MTDRLTIADYRALAELRYQLRRFERFSERAARTVGLEPRQHQLLLAVKGMPAGVPATIGLLAERLQVRHHTAVELVDRMQARGLVRRLRAGADRRRVFVYLTRRAVAVLPRLSYAHRTELRSVAPALRRTLDTFVPVAGGRRGSASGRRRAS